MKITGDTSAFKNVSHGPSNVSLKRQYSTAITEIVSLKNALADLMPNQSMGLSSNQLSNFETLAVNNRYVAITINRLILGYLYVEHGIIQAAIDMPVQDAIRGGIDISSPELDADDIKALQEDLESEGDLQVAAEACIWKRLFGGSGVIVNNGEDPSQPLNLKDIDQVRMLEFYPADRWELSSPHRTAESFNFYKAKVHSSRVLTMIGKKAPSFIRPQLAGWGMSECERMVRDLNAYLKNKDVIFDLLDEAKVDVYRIKGLQARLATNAGTDRVKRQIQVTNQLKSYNNALVMDLLDEYEQKTQTFSGLAEMIKENRIGIASAVRMPMTKLFGISAAGFNSGEDDIENYNAMVETEIRTPLRPVITTMLELRAIQKFGIRPAMTWKYKPLRMMSELDEENIKTSRQNRLNSLYSLGLLMADEHAQAMRAYELMPIETRAEKGLLPDQPLSPGAQAMGQLGQEEGEQQPGGDKPGKPTSNKPEKPGADNPKADKPKKEAE